MKKSDLSEFEIQDQDFKLRIKRDQAAKLGLGGLLERAVDVPATGDFINGLDLELRLVGR